MGAVVVFPSPLANKNTPRAVEVIVAPAAGLWVAWLRLACGRYTPLERTPDEQHALRDARAYADRHRIPVSVLKHPLAVVLDQSAPSRRRRGEVSIWLDPQNSGRWQIDHSSAGGGSVGIVGHAFSLSEAVTIARDAAQQLGATFDEGETFGGDAA